MLRIGYGGYSTSFEVPGDRRRFCSYAKTRGIQFEFADSRKDYDLVYITYSSDLPAWIEKKKEKGDKMKLIFELIDSYLVEPITLKSKLRGVLRFATGTNSKLVFDFNRTLQEICCLADGVVCSTLEQKRDIEQFNDNVHVSLDIFEGDISNIQKRNFTNSEKLKLVWEGQPYTLSNILILKDVLNELADNIELHIVTDIHYFRFFKKYFKKETKHILDELTCTKIFHTWDKKTFSKIITNCDLALIPISLEHGMTKGKPENKLVLFWKLGMPVLTSNTPAYVRAMEKGDLDIMYCENKREDWKEGINLFRQLKLEDRTRLAKKGQDFANSYYSEEKLLTNWDRIFESINVMPSI